MGRQSLSDRYNYLRKFAEEPTKVGYSHYICILCDKVKLLKDHHVRTNATISCGCTIKLSKFREDLTGKVINGNTVIGYESGGVWRVKRGCGCIESFQTERVKVIGDLCKNCNRPNVSKRLVERNFKHGLTSSRTYSCWMNMKKRCQGSTNRAEFYSGKGITYPPKWETFGGFLEDMGECPDKYSLEREDVTKSYSKDNCSWASVKTQANNKTNNILISNGEEVMSLKHWCDLEGLKYRTQFARFRYGGKSIEFILGDKYRLAKDKFDI
ncbi:MAG: hypothetical protein [Cystoviridae sp.]|nr:MAG: hypothetical protein [Cystoviridae sp.]